MQEIEFKYWMDKQAYSKKVQSDTISRLKKLERIYNFIDIDTEYSKDNCTEFLLIFKNKGENEEMKKLNSSSLPVGKYQLSTYKYALNLYIKFLKSL